MSYQYYLYQKNFNAIEKKNDLIKDNNKNELHIYLIHKMNHELDCNFFIYTFTEEFTVPQQCCKKF